MVKKVENKSAKRTISKKKATRRQENPFFVVGIGASAGGLRAILELVSYFRPDVNAAFLIVLHLSKVAAGDILLSRIQRMTTLPCRLADQGDQIRPGTVYIARPDVHLLVKKNELLIGNGPPENRFRPSIDVLFRSMAAQYGARSVGIVLTGLLNDGTMGMWGIKQSGGICIVQDPNEAEYPDMPVSVLENFEVDYCLPVSKIAEAVFHSVSGKARHSTPPPINVRKEAELSEKAAISMPGVAELGSRSLFVCPDCGGGLWRVADDKFEHFRCHVGHSYSQSDLLIRQAENVENTLWAALRMMEERRMLLQKIAKDHMQRGFEHLSGTYQNNAANLEHHIQKLKDLLFTVKKE